MPSRPKTSLVRHLLLALTACCCIPTACTEADRSPFEEDLDADLESSYNGRLAYLSVISRNAFGQARVPLTISAQFVDFDGVELAAVRQSLDLWAPPEDLADDACVLVEGHPQIGLENWSPSRVLLMHAGSIRVQGEGEAVELRPRRMPDLFPFFCGYTYGTERQQRPSYPAGSTVRLESPGGEDVDAFAVSVRIPEPLTLTRINDQPVGSVEAFDVANFDEGLLVGWTESTNGDVIYLTLEEDGRGAGAVLTCSAFDDGTTMLPKDLLQEFLRVSDATLLRLTLRRIGIQSFDLDGFDMTQAAAASEHSILLY